MSAQPTALPLTALRAQAEQPREVNLPAVRSGFFDLQGFELSQRVAKAFASSTLVPKDYQGNLANCMVAINMAQRLNADPLMVMQNLVVVHGRPTWSAQFLIATVNACGRFSALRYEFFGTKGADDWGCRAYAVEKSTGEKLVGSDVSIAIAKKEGWYGKNGSKWQSIPQQMLMYRAGSWWTRAYAPELSMGLMTADEAGDVFDAAMGPDGSFAVDVAALRDVTSAVEGEVIAGDRPGETIDTATGEVIQTGGTEPAESEPQSAPQAASKDEPAPAADPPKAAAPRRQRGPIE